MCYLIKNKISFPAAFPKLQADMIPDQNNILAIKAVVYNFREDPKKVMTITLKQLNLLFKSPAVVLDSCHLSGSIFF